MKGSPTAKPKGRIRIATIIIIERKRFQLEKLHLKQ